MSGKLNILFLHSSYYRLRQKEYILLTSLLLKKKIISGWSIMECLILASYINESYE